MCFRRRIRRIICRIWPSLGDSLTPIFQLLHQARLTLSLLHSRKDCGEHNGKIPTGAIRGSRSYLVLTMLSGNFREIDSDRGFNHGS